MTRLLFVGDVHISDRAPSTRRASYREEIFAKLEEVADIAADRDVDSVVFLGDVFHSKIPRNTSHETVRRLIGVLGQMPNPLVVPGNHDYQAAQADELVRSPLGVVAASGCIRMFGVPGARAVSLGGQAVAGVREEEPLEAFMSVGEVKVVAAHSSIFPPGTDVPFEFFPAERVAAAVPYSVRLVAYGHIHDEHGAYEVDGVKFMNFGSISRGSLFESNPQRVPAVGLVEVSSDGVDITRIPLESAKPWDEVFRVEEVMAERSREGAAAEFAAALSQESLQVFSIERLVASLASEEDVDVRVRARAVELVEGAAS